MKGYVITIIVLMSLTGWQTFYGFSVTDYQEAKPDSHLNSLVTTTFDSVVISLTTIAQNPPSEKPKLSAPEYAFASLGAMAICVTLIARRRLKTKRQPIER